MQIDVLEAQNYMQIAALEAGKIHKKYFGLKDLDSRDKDGVDFTTIVDKETDEFLIDMIRRKYPSVILLTEETAPDDYSSLMDAEYLYVSDPLDGTTNFSRGHVNFAVSQAMVYRGKTVVSVVYLPISGDMYTTNSATGISYHNGHVMKVSSTSDLKKSVVACDWPWDLKKR